MEGLKLVNQEVLSAWKGYGMKEKQEMGNSIYGLRHHKGCKIYAAHIEKVLNSVKDAVGYCTCPIYNPLRKKKDHIK